MSLVVVITDPRNVIVLDEVKFITGLRVEAVVTPKASIQNALEEYYRTEQTIEIEKVYEKLDSAAEYELELTSEEAEINLTEFQHTGG